MKDAVLMRKYRYFQFTRYKYYFPHWDIAPLFIYGLYTGAQIISAFRVSKILNQLDKIIGYEILKRCEYYE